MCNMYSHVVIMYSYSPAFLDSALEKDKDREKESEIDRQPIRFFNVPTTAPIIPMR